MPRYIALLRAINVGGHVVKMDRLRTLFEELGFSDVSTFIASGNVLFETPSKDVAAIATQIEEHLMQALGYDVVTFIRTPKQVEKIAELQPFPATEVDVAGTGLYVGFLCKAPTPSAREKLMKLCSKENEFRVREREVYWLVRTKLSDSSFSGSKMERVLGMPMTMRNITTVQKLAALPAAATMAPAKKPSAAL